MTPARSRVGIVMAPSWPTPDPGRGPEAREWGQAHRGPRGGGHARSGDGGVVGDRGRDGATAADLAPFVAACAAGGVGLASCRLACERLRESMLLEEIGFRFIEMVYQPEFGDLASAGPGDVQGLEVVRGIAQLSYEW